ncbi:MAG: hypothetical protein ACON5P_03610 [Candidatus Puniceispirillaceae bacterium]
MDINIQPLCPIWQLVGGYKYRAKRAGLGREGSKYGIDEFLEIKLMVIGSV